MFGALTAIAALAAVSGPPATGFPKGADVKAWAERAFDAKGWTFEGLVESSDAAFALFTRPSTQNGVVLKTLYLRREFLAASDGGRSAAELVDIDCDRKKFRVEQSTIYGENNLKGEVRSISDATDWRSIAGPPAFDRALLAACDGPSSPSMTAGLGEGPPARPIAPALHGLLPIRASVTRTQPPALAEPSPAGATETLGGASAGEAPASPPTPQAQAALALSLAPAKSKPPRGGAAVQVGAYAGEGLAKAGLSGFQTRYADVLNALQLDVAPGEGPRGPVFRLVVSGFADNAAALSFCEALRTRGGACFVRRETVR